MLRISYDSNLGEYIERLKAAMAEEARHFTRDNRGKLSSIIRGNIIYNHRLLGMGGNIRTPGGGTYAWDMGRHPRTLAIRRRRGLGPHPVLRFTGLLQRGLENGVFSFPAQGVEYRPMGEARAIIDVHERGLPPLPVRRARAAGRRPIVDRVPVRRSFFWSKLMLDEVSEEVVKDAMRRIHGKFQRPARLRRISP